MGNKNEVFEYLIDQLRQQVNNNQCEDLAHEVQSLRNQLRDMSELVDELHLALVKATGDEEAYKLIRKQEQSGCRKDDTQECKHEWRTETLYGARVVPTYCRKCGVYKQKDEKNDTQEWPYRFYYVVTDGSEQSGCRKGDEQECEHDWVLDEKGDYFVCAKCGKREAELIDCQHTNTVGLRKGFAPGFTKKCLDCGAKLR